LDHAGILDLISEGKATFGIYVRCQETGLRELRDLEFPLGSHTFAPGALLGRVQLRPMIWTREILAAYLPNGAHSEYTEPMSVGAGQFLALDVEHVFDVSHPSLPPIESIFEVKENPNLAEGEFMVDTGADRIAIRMASQTFQLVQQLRDTNGAARAALMSALYAPAIMEILDQLREGTEDFERFRWLHPFRARCTSVGVDLDNPSLLNDAQRLLGNPFADLSFIISEG